jgi:hypothetical protein
MAIKGLLLVQAHVPVQTKPTPFHRVVVELVVGIFGIPSILVFYEGVALALARPLVESDRHASKATALAKVVGHISLAQVVGQIANEEGGRFAKFSLAHSSSRWRTIVVTIIAPVAVIAPVVVIAPVSVPIVPIAVVAVTIALTISIPIRRVAPTRGRGTRSIGLEMNEKGGDEKKRKSK